MIKKYLNLITFAAIAWLGALGYAQYNERKPWTAEKGSVHLAECRKSHDECLLQERIHRGWNSDVYELTTLDGTAHRFMWDDINSLSHPVPKLSEQH